MVRKEMVTKTEELHRELLPLRVVRFNEIVEKARGIIEATPSHRYIYRKYVRRMVEAGKLHRVRRGLYVVLSPLEKPGYHVTDKLLIASKVRDKYYLGFHTALEYYGCAQSLYNEAYVCVKTEDRFDPFRYGRFVFRPVFVRDTDLEVEDKPYQENVLRVSSKERTFIECLDRVRYAGGWEECLKSLEGLGGLDFEKLIDLLLRGGKSILLRRVGYVLELLKKHSYFYEHLEDQLLGRITERISGSPRHLMDGEPGPLNERWSLYVPSDFEEKLRGI